MGRNGTRALLRRPASADGLTPFPGGRSSCHSGSFRRNHRVSSPRSRIDRSSPPASAAGLAAGRAALDRGDWEAALHAFESLPASEAEQPEALEGLGLAAWWLDLGDTVFDVRERAYRAYRERGDALGRGAHGHLARVGHRRVSRRTGHRQRVAAARPPAARRAARCAGARLAGGARRHLGAARRRGPARGAAARVGGGARRPGDWRGGLRDGRPRGARLRACHGRRGRRGPAGARRGERGGAGRRDARSRAHRPRVLLPHCRLRAHPRLRARDAVVRSPQGVLHQRWGSGRCSPSAAPSTRRSACGAGRGTKPSTSSPPRPTSSPPAVRR